MCIWFIRCKYVQLLFVCPTSVCLYSRTPDQNFCCFYQFKIILSHLPKHVRQTQSPVFLAMANLFSHFNACQALFPTEMVGPQIGIIRIYHECEGGIEKSVPRITVWHQEACRVITTVIPRDGIFYPNLTQMKDYFSCSLLFYYFKISFKKSLNTLRCNGTW